MEYQRSAERRIRIGIVGAGSHSYRNILSTLTYLPVELVAVTDIDPRTAEATARQYAARPYTSTAEMYAREDLEAVLLCVSPRLHPPLAIEAFEAGLHVWMEKPVGVLVEDVERMIAARGDRICVVGYKKAFMPAIRKAIELIEHEADGPLRTLMGTYPLSIPENGAELLAARETSKWLVDGCHPLSALLAVGGPVESVAVHRSPHGGGHCILNHENGAVTDLVLAQGVSMFQPFEQYLFIAGNQSVHIENTRRVTFQRGIDFTYSTGTDFTNPGTDRGAVVWEAQDGLNTLENKAVFTQGLWGELEHFCRAVIADEAATIGTLEFALELMRVYEATMLSDGSLVEVKQERQLV